MGHDRLELIKSLQIGGGQNPIYQTRQLASRKHKMVAASGIVSLAVVSSWTLFHVDAGRNDVRGVPVSLAVSTAQVPSISEAAPPQSSKQPAASGITALGYIVAERQATVSAETTGKLLDVRVREGQHVRAGQVLATLDSSIADANLSVSEGQRVAAEARIDMLQAQLVAARASRHRAEQLVQDGFGSISQLIKAAADENSLIAQIQEARANLDVAQSAVARDRALVAQYTVTAPFDGIVTERAAEPGEIVSPISAGGGFTRTGICTIVDTGSVEVAVDLNETFINRVARGQHATITLDAYPNWRIPATVVAIIPSADRQKGTIRLRLTIDTADSRILPDMAATVHFGDDTGLTDLASQSR